MGTSKIGKGMRTATLLVTVFLLVIASPLWATQRLGYILDDVGNQIPSPLSYTFYAEINGIDYECGPFRDPQDIFVDKQGNLFVVDSGNDRIVKFDKSHSFVAVLGNEAELNEPEGVFVDKEGNIYVADTGNSRILKLDTDGHLLQEYKRPSSPLFGKTRFSPTKLVVDAREYLYVIDKGDVRGFVLFDGKGLFRGFLAAIRLPFSLTRLFFQLFATTQQKEDVRTRRNPRSYSNINIDDSGFVYAVAGYLKTNQIKKISPVGINVYPEEFYGEIRLVEDERILPIFVDVAVNEFGIVSVLDTTSGKIYQYDQEGNLLTVLGGRGKQKDLFEYPPVSIATGKKGTLYVLDSVNANIKVFYPTELTQLVHQAARLYFDGKYYEAENLWKEVAEKNSNFALAHTGLGKALLKRGDYLAAMEEFRYAKDKEGFSKAFKEYRYIQLRKNFGWIALWILIGIIALAILSKLISKLLGKYGKEAGNFLKTFSHLFMILIRPRETLDNIKKANLFSVLVFVLLFFLIQYLRILLTSFHFSTFDPARTSFLTESMKLFLPWITWILASYGVSIILDGQGTLKDVFVSSALCLAPYIIFSVPLSLLSRILVLEQKGYYDFLNYLIYAWVIFLFFYQVKIVHNFSSKKAVGFSLLSVLGIGISWASIALIYILSYQIVDFVRQIILEISVRG